MTRKGQGIAYDATWMVKMQLWVEQWVDAAADVHIPSDPYDPSTEDAYLRWFHAATWVRCIPMSPEAPHHDLEITNTFAPKLAVAYHAMVREASYIQLTFILILNVLSPAL